MKDVSFSDHGFPVPRQFGYRVPPNTSKSLSAGSRLVEDRLDYGDVLLLDLRSETGRRWAERNP
jgi:hypothetical protein